jgi:hypothetical protein
MKNKKILAGLLIILGLLFSIGIDVFLIFYGNSITFGSNTWHIILNIISIVSNFATAIGIFIKYFL